MLEQLEQIDWNSLTHAYGPAGDIPKLIRDLAFGDAEKRDKAWWALYGNIYHQGTVYEATSYAVPFLIDLLKQDLVPDRANILVYLVGLAHGKSYIHVHQSLEFLKEIFSSPESQQQMEQELNWIRKTVAAVQEGISVYLQLLKHNESQLRVAAAYTLAHIGPLDSSAINQIRQCSLTEKDPQAKVSLILALGNVGDRHTETVEALSNWMRKSELDLIRLTSAISLLKIKQEVDTYAIQMIMDALINLKDDPDDDALQREFMELPWANGEDLISYIGFCLSFLPEKQSLEIVSILVDSFSKIKNRFSALTVVQALLGLVFKNNVKQEEIEERKLTPIQKRVLGMIANHPIAWTFMNISSILSAYHLPTNPEDLKFFINNN